MGPSIGPSVRNAFFSIGQKWVETNKNEISDDEAGRDYMSHDLFRVYELVLHNKDLILSFTLAFLDLEKKVLFSRQD